MAGPYSLTHSRAVQGRREGLQTPVLCGGPLRPETWQGDSLWPGAWGPGLSTLQLPTAQPLRSALTATRPRATAPRPLSRNTRLLPSPGSPQPHVELACCIPLTDVPQTRTTRPSQALGPRHPTWVPRVHRMGPHTWSSCNFTDLTSHPHTPTSGQPALI